MSYANLNINELKNITMMCPSCFQKFRFNVNKDIPVHYPSGMHAPVIDWDIALRAYCPHCFAKYDSRNDARALTSEEANMHRAGSFRVPLIHVDEDIIDAIIALNRRGYRTSFSCAGHIEQPFDTRWWGKLSDDHPVGNIERLPILSRGYVMFTKPWADRLPAPDDWEWEMNHSPGCKHFSGRDLQQSGIEPISAKAIEKWAIAYDEANGTSIGKDFDTMVHVYVREHRPDFIVKCKSLLEWALKLPVVQEDEDDKILQF